MRIVRNLLALVGALTLVAVGAAILLFEPYVNKARSLDPSALAVYADMARTVLFTGDAMQALVHQRRVPAGRTVSDVENSLAQAAAERGLHALGVVSVHREILDQTGQEFPYLQVHLFCDPALAADLMRHNPAMASFLPCRVIVFEDPRGGLSVMTPNLDLVLHGGHPLPVILQERAAGLQSLLREIVDHAAGVERPHGPEAFRSAPIAAGSER